MATLFEYLNEIILSLLNVMDLIGQQVLKVLAYPIDPGQRIFGLYLFTSLLFALFVYVRKRHSIAQKTQSGSGLFRFLFPKSVWSHPSAWLDVRYFFVHQMLRLVIYGALVAGVTAVVFTVGMSITKGFFGEGALITAQSIWPLEVFLVLLTVAAFDFAAYIIHAAQHKSAFLWEFHKVHHSAVVMHPLTNYREHPVDNVLYALGHGLTLGLCGVLSFTLLGNIPTEPGPLGVGITAFLFNLFGYNLRHSHIWVRWPGALSMAFGSPAHHQVHHSSHPDHIDKNFAFMLPIWDVMFGTYCVPKTNEAVEFGLGTGEEGEFKTVFDLYFLPFKKALQLKMPKPQEDVTAHAVSSDD